MKKNISDMGCVSPAFFLPGIIKVLTHHNSAGQSLAFGVGEDAS